MHSYCVTNFSTSVLFTAICPGTCRRPDFMSICADDKCAKGECEDHDGDKSCSCYAGWTGETCETGMSSKEQLFVKTLFICIRSFQIILLSCIVHLMQREYY